jgi:peptidoglycan/xylan/chitin deacetylase (PgdA/CDA1 family)
VTSSGCIVFLLFHDVYVSDPRESGFASPAADRYKLTADQFDRHLSALARVRPHVRPFSLTFDDAGSSYYTTIADRLEELGWRGYCFVPTDFIGRPGFLTRAQIGELDRRGHHIGSHSASHPIRISACSQDAVLGEWRRSVGTLQDILGHSVTTASVPGGYYSRGVAEAAATAGLKVLFTSEPVTRGFQVGHCAIAGRFTIRASSPPHLSERLVGSAPWSRWSMWAAWTAKKSIKPLLGPAYQRVADWLSSQKPLNSHVPSIHHPGE